MRHALVVVGTLLALVAGAPAAPLDSNLGSATNGGGCYPTGVTPALLDMLVLINPEWSPVFGGPVVDSDPVQVAGTVQEMHGDRSGDFPATHIRADVVHVLDLDPANQDKLATGNDDGFMQTEWEAGAYPPWAWAGDGDRMVGLGRLIFDCGHPNPVTGKCSLSTAHDCVLDADCRPPLCSACGATEICVGTQYRYSSELHPPYATAAIRQGRGGIVSSRPGAGAVLETRVDLYSSNFAGGAGDRCVLTHQPSELGLLTVVCYPLTQPIANLNVRDFSFDVPLPPRPSRGKLSWRLSTLPPPDGVAPRVRVQRRGGMNPHLTVTLRLSRKVAHQLPTGFAGTLHVGWRNDTTPLTHVRLTISELVVHNALQPATPSVPRTCSVSNTGCATDGDCPGSEQCLGLGPVKSWRGQAAVNGEWQDLVGLDTVNSGDVVAQGVVFDQYLPATGSVHLLGDVRAHECIDKMYGRPLAQGLLEFGFNKGVACLATQARNPGAIDVTYSGPDFGAGSGSMDYETVGVGGSGGFCSLSSALRCVVDPDCPGGETCLQTGGSWALRYRIEKLP